MTYHDSYGRGHMGRALPGLTPGVKILLIVNLAGFVLNNLLTVGKYRTFLGLSWDGMWDGYGLGLVRLVSYQFIHSLSLGHIVWNMLWLYWFGTMVEGRGVGAFGGVTGSLGRSGLVRLYLLSGIVGGLLYVAMGALFSGDSSIPVIGASGAVYGIMMFAACLNPRQPINLILFTTELRYLVGFCVFVGLYYSYLGLTQGGSGDGTAHSAHLGGVLGGYLCYKFGLARESAGQSGPFAWWRRRAEQRAVGAEQGKQETLDKILQKINEQGMNSLTAAERRFLEKVSKQSRK